MWTTKTKYLLSGPVKEKLVSPAQHTDLVCWPTFLWCCHLPPSDNPVKFVLWHPMVKWVYEEFESCWSQISGVINLGSSSPSLTNPNAFTIFIDLLCLTMLDGSESYCLTDSKYETDISPLKLYRKVCCLFQPLGDRSMYIPLLPQNMYSNTLMSKITQGSLERTNPQTCLLEVQALPNHLKISDLATYVDKRQGITNLLFIPLWKGQARRQTMWNMCSGWPQL